MQHTQPGSGHSTLDEDSPGTATGLAIGIGDASPGTGTTADIETSHAAALTAATSTGTAWPSNIKAGPR